ncbi:MAG: hypothetical protein K2X74_15610 [Acetobacteraceae bacterium]|nr:hypothetical protein [Acetobacteraceae bacterium]
MRARTIVGLCGSAVAARLGRIARRHDELAGGMPAGAVEQHGGVPAPWQGDCTDITRILVHGLCQAAALRDGSAREAALQAVIGRFGDSLLA